MSILSSLLITLQQQLIHFMPGHCLLCQRPTSCTTSYCMACLHALPRNTIACHCCALPLISMASSKEVRCIRCLRRPRFQRATVPLIYTGDVPALIHAFKFYAALPAATLLANLLGKAFVPTTDSWLLLVPQHPSRAKQRGFDHIDWLASLCPTTRNLPRIKASRRYNTPPLRHVNRRQRLKLMKDAFVIDDSLHHKHVVLLDDVMTTGATLNALARMCLQQGAKSVEALAVARTPPSAWNMRYSKNEEI